MAMSTKSVSGDEAVHYVPPRKRRKRSPAKMQPPLTPMIDVTFQLLLFFLLTMTFREAEGLIPSTLPGNLAEPQESEAPSIVIKIDPAPAPKEPVGAVYEIEGYSFKIHEPGKLYNILWARKKVAGDAQTPVVIEPRGDVLWEHVVNAVNQAVRAKYTKIAFAASR